MNDFEKIISEMREIVQSSPCLALPLSCWFVSAVYRSFVAEARKSVFSEED